MGGMDGLSQYGAVGIILASVLGLFLWAFKRLFEHVLLQQDKSSKIMDEAVKALYEIRESILRGNADVVRQMEKIADAATAKVISEVRRP